MLANYQAYNKLFKDRLTPLIEAEWAATVLSKRTTEEERAEKIPQIPIDFRNNVLKKMLGAEPLEVREQVEAWRQAQRAPIENAKDETEEETVRFDKAEEYHK